MAITNASRITSADNVRYLRVSSSGQVDTDYNPEGISLPAQRKACVVRERECNSHGSCSSL
jgi:site-specific DNA recombinase